MNKRKPKEYSLEFKKSAVQLALRSPSIKIAATELSIPVPTLNTWVYRFKDGKLGTHGELTAPEMDALDPATAKQLKENLAKLLEVNRRLNKKIASLEEDRLILKKSAAFFAREQR